MCTNPIKIIVNGEEKTVKCGKCITCQREKASDWAIKLINENKYHKKACFITLTFDNKILIKGNEYGANCSFLYHIENSKEYFQKFIKRLRKHFKNKRLTYFHVAEYGEKTKRCHHHLILWGENFEETRHPFRISKTGHPQDYSTVLNELWACGDCTIQDINPNNTIYISQYSIKKFKQTNDRYKGKITFSNRAKISTKWIRRNYNEIKKGFLKDNDGKIYKIPESYKKILKESKREEEKEAYRKYEENIMEYISNNNPNDIIERQKTKEKIYQYRNKEKSRDF